MYGVVLVRREEAPPALPPPTLVLWPLSERETSRAILPPIFIGWWSFVGRMRLRDLSCRRLSFGHLQGGGEDGTPALLPPIFTAWLSSGWTMRLRLRSSPCRGGFGSCDVFCLHFSNQNDTAASQDICARSETITDAQMYGTGTKLTA